MKICIFADVHGNLEALELLLKNEEETVDCFFFLGDIFGYFYNQREIIRRLMDISNIYAIKGNHDLNYINGIDDCGLRSECINKYGDSYNECIELQEEQYLRSLPDYIRINLGGKKICAYHGGPLDIMNERIYPNSDIVLGDKEKDLDYLFLGHSHYRFVKIIGKTLIINPGSIGQPRDKKGFSYCVLNTDNNHVDFKSVDVNINQLLEQVKIRDYNTINYHYLIKKYEV